MAHYQSSPMNHCWLALLISALLLAACEQETSTSAPTPPPAVEEVSLPTVASTELDEQTRQWWDDAGIQIENAANKATQLRENIAALLQQPSEEQLQATRDAWFESHDAFQAAMPLISMTATNPNLFAELERWRKAVDAWPIEPGYLDSYAEYTTSGIVNDITVELSAQALRSQHLLTDDSEIVTGFHSLAFLLWGEDGKRQANFFQAQAADSQTELPPTSLPENRRRTLLQLLANILAEDLHNLAQSWASQQSVIRLAYLRHSPAARITLVRSAFAYYLEHESTVIIKTATEEGGAREIAHMRFAHRGLHDAVPGLVTLLSALDGAAGSLLCKQPAAAADILRGTLESIGTTATEAGAEKGKTAVDGEAMLAGLAKVVEAFHNRVQEDAQTEELPSKTDS